MLSEVCVGKAANCSAMVRRTEPDDGRLRSAQMEWTPPSLRGAGSYRNAEALQNRSGINVPSMTPFFATLIFNGELACLNLFGVVVGVTPRTTMRFAPDDP